MDRGRSSWEPATSVLGLWCHAEPAELRAAPATADELLTTGHEDGKCDAFVFRVACALIEAGLG
jgi:hypothetical protein